MAGILSAYRKGKSVGEKHGLTMVIPVFNRVGMVADTLASVAAQTRRPDEVILIDNGSADGSWEYLYKWKEDMESRGWRVTVKREVRPGAARARQTGLEFTTTDYVMFFDSDDTMPADHVEKIMRDFEEDPRLDISAWGVTFHTPDGKSRRRRILHGRVLENHLVQGLFSTQGYAVRTSFLREAGGWNPVIGGWDDWELGLRLLMHNPKIKVNKERRVDLTVQEESITGIGFGHRIGDWEHTIGIMEEYVRESDDERRDYILRMLAYRRIMLAAYYHREGYREESSQLYEDALSMPELTRRDDRILRLAYRYTASGLPGAGAIFPPLIRNSGKD